MIARLQVMINLFIKKQRKTSLAPRKNPRIRNYDYSSPNYYFVTICTREKACIFGMPEKPSAFGKIVSECLSQISKHFPNVTVDKWVVMPNHIHAIFILHGGTNLSSAVGQFKSSVTRQIHQNDPRVSVWQASYHDHIIRNEADYQRIWSYIDNNPQQWAEDCFYEPTFTT